MQDDSSPTTGQNIAPGTPQREKMPLHEPQSTSPRLRSPKKLIMMPVDRTERRSTQGCCRCCLDDQTVKVEPKTFFANERTFIQWMTAGMLLAAIAATLLDGQEDNTPGVVFIAISIAVMLYALVAFQWRSARIRQRAPGPYDDRLGPVALTTALVLALIVTTHLQLREEADMCKCAKSLGWSIQAATCVVDATTSWQEAAFCTSHKRGPTAQDRFQHSLHDVTAGCSLIADSISLPPFFTPSGLAWSAQHQVLLTVSKYQLCTVSLEKRLTTVPQIPGNRSITGSGSISWSVTATAEPVKDLCGCVSGHGWSNDESTCEEGKTTSVAEAAYCALNMPKVAGSSTVSSFSLGKNANMIWSLPDLDVESITLGQNASTIFIGIERPVNASEFTIHTA